MRLKCWPDWQRNVDLPTLTIHCEPSYDSNMDVRLTSALVGAAASLVVAGLAQWLEPRSQRSLARLTADLNLQAERLKKELERQSDVFRNEFQRQLEEIRGAVADRNSARAARRDYEYEARKRLYEQVEPILFQLYEALEEAHYRVRSLARSSRNGNLGNSSLSMRPSQFSYLFLVACPCHYIHKSRAERTRLSRADLSLS
jgi:hypothetical protein